MTTYKTIRYNKTDTPVHLGDHVRARHFFRRHLCRVVYVPGQSPFHSDFEHDGLKWLGLRSEKGRLIMPLIDPETFEVRPIVEFIRRDETPIPQFDPKVPLEPGMAEGMGDCEKYEK